MPVAHESNQVVVIGLGNADRGDDAVGLEVARRLREHKPANTRVIEHTGDTLAMIDVWNEVAVTYVVDAALCGKPPGTVHRIENDAGGARREMLRCSSHAFGFLETLELARALGRAPRRLIIYAIEGRRFEVGHALSLELVVAAEIVTQRMLAEIAAESAS